MHEQRHALYMFESGEIAGSARLAFPFIATDAGKSEGSYKRQRNDCAVRAMATAYDWTYDQANRYLADHGRRTGKRCDFSAIMEQITPQPVRLSFQAIKGQRRMNPATFAATYREGTYIVKTAKHVIAVINGTFYDDVAPRPDRCIYRAWRIR